MEIFQTHHRPFLNFKHRTTAILFEEHKNKHQLIKQNAYFKIEQDIFFHKTEECNK